MCTTVSTWETGLGGSCRLLDGCTWPIGRDEGSDDDRSGKEAVEGFGRELACEDKQAFSVADLRAPIGDVVRERFGVDVSEQASRSDREEGAHVVCAAGVRDPVGEV